MTKGIKERSIRDVFNEIKIEGQFIEQAIQLIESGDTALQQSRIVETMIVDDSWIYNIETLLYSVENIVKNPQRFIKENYRIVNVEKAKRITSETIRHLAANTNYIRAIGDDGRIQPSKVLTKEMDEDLYIYENRFVATLITRLISFIEQRYTAISDQIDTYDTTRLKLRSKFKLGTGDVDYNVDIKVRNEPANKIELQKNHELLAKIEIVRRRILILTGTEFYKQISKLKPINPPIMKTNMLRMHTDYSNCYKLWVFISSYDMVGFSVDVSDKILPVDNDYYNDLTMLVAISIKTMMDNNAIKAPAYKKIAFRHRRTKRYRELRRIDYTPSFRGVAEQSQEDIVNQFYYDKLHELVAEKDEIKSGDIINTVQLNTTFQRIFRNLSNLNNEIFKELMEITKYPTPLRRQTTLQKQLLEYRRQEELYKKYQLISRLKVAELQRTLIRENTQRIKLERLRFNYNQMLEKSDSKAKKKRAPRKTLNAAKRLENLYARAKKDEKFRMSKEYARQQAVLEKEEQRLLNLEKAREERRRIGEIAKEIRNKEKQDEKD